MIYCFRFIDWLNNGWFKNKQKPKKYMSWKFLFMKRLSRHPGRDILYGVGQYRASNFTFPNNDSRKIQNISGKYHITL